MNFEELEEMADDIRSTPHSSVGRDGCLEMFDLIEKMHNELFTLHIENKNLRDNSLVIGGNGKLDHTRYDLMSTKELEQLLGLDKIKSFQLTDNAISREDNYDEWYREELINLLNK